MSSALDQKLAALGAWQEEINKENKRKGTGMAVLAAGERIVVPRMATGAPGLDIRLGGGWPRGALIEVFGPNGSGKSTLAYGTIAELHRREPEAVAVLVDVEGSYSGKRGKAMGIDPDRLLIFRIATAEPALQKVKELMDLSFEGKPVVDLIVLDSIASLVTDAEDEGDLGDAQVGVLARLMSKTCRQFSGIASRTGITLIFTNQIRMKIGVLYGSPETTPGGEAMKFYSWSRVRTSRRETLREGSKDDGRELGILTRASIEKAKVDDSVGGAAMVRINRADGLDASYDITTLGPKLGVVIKTGNALSAETSHGTVKGAGREAFMKALKENRPAMQELYDRLVKAGMADENDALEEMLDPDGPAVELAPPSDDAVAPEESAEAA